MSTNLITPSIDYPNVSEATPYNFNVPVKLESEINVLLLDEEGLDITSEIEYVLSATKSMGSLLFDVNTVSITWIGDGSLPAVNTLRIYRRTQAVQQTVFELGADISIETESEVDRLTRSQQDNDNRFDETEDALEEINVRLDDIDQLIADNKAELDQAILDARADLGQDILDLETSLTTLIDTNKAEADAAFLVINDRLQAIEDQLTANETELIITEAIYFGDQVTDGSFRLIKDGNDLKTQVLIGGVWTSKDILEG